MAVYEKDLIPPLARQMGDTDSSAYTYTSNQLFSAINDGIQELRRRGYKQEFVVSGSGDIATISPDPSEDEKRLLVLCSALVLTEGEIQKSARNAILHQNAAGKTDLTKIADYLLKIRDKLEEQIDDSIDDALTNTDSVDNEGDTLVEGEELKSTTTANADNYSEGLVRTEITTGV